MTSFRSDVQTIWHAGLDAVRSEPLMRAAVQLDGKSLVIDDEPLDLRSVERIAVVGAGKAGAAMAAELEAILGERLMAEKQLTGWVNVPDDCVRKLARIHLHGARPPGWNEPTAAGMRGTAEMLKIVGTLGPRDLCLCLISGGGSALMPAPADGITLDDKVAVTRHLSSAGANIAQLNTVRKQLSRVKGGGLIRDCRAGRLISLIISDVLGDPLDVIASGPTVTDTSSPAEALSILEQFSAREAGISQQVFDYLRQKQGQSPAQTATACEIRNLVIGNNAMAVDAAGLAAERLGYSHAMVAATRLEGPVEDIGRHLAQVAIQMRDQHGPNCLISGGEGTVKLARPEVRGLGGRNQQLVLAALIELVSRGEAQGITILSGGTDGEDGPTDAAGAWMDPDLTATIRSSRLDPLDHLMRNDAYHFFAPLGALLKTGPTHTNVCDLRVVLVEQQSPAIRAA
jgi:hydroxypyruvate reductase